MTIVNAGVMAHQDVAVGVAGNGDFIALFAGFVILSFGNAINLRLMQ